MTESTPITIKTFATLDSNKRIIRTVAPSGQVKNYTRDSQGRVTRYEDSDGTVEIYVYEGDELVDYIVQEIET